MEDIECAFSSGPRDSGPPWTGGNAASDIGGLSSRSICRRGGIRLTASPAGYRNRIAVDLDAGGALTNYWHDAGTHRLAISLDAVTRRSGQPTIRSSRSSRQTAMDTP